MINNINSLKIHHQFYVLGLMLAKEAHGVSGPKLVDFKKTLTGDPQFCTRLHDLKEEVVKFSESFPLPGLDEY